MEDTDEFPRMSGALEPQNGPRELVNGSSEVDNGNAGFLQVASDSKNLSRSPSFLNDVQMHEGGDNEVSSGAEDTITAAGAPSAVAPAAVATPPDTLPALPLSKNGQKKLKRQQKWEDGREDRKRRRKEKRLQKQAQRRAAKAEGVPGATGEAESEATVSAPVKERVLVPVSLIFDCAFESYMRETELISLSGQITRSYAANRMATRQARIFVSSWHGKLRTRYETLLANQHKRWQNAFFLEGDFLAAGRQAEEIMRGEGGGVVVDVLGGEEGKPEITEATQATQVTEAAQASGEGSTTSLNSVVYLTSDSPHTLMKLEPYTSYVIGGIVDKNREKGLCYGRAQEHGVRTAKLPIGDYMVMASRKVLTTNHVVEIMLKWLETGDWAMAFEHVMPKRKGGRLRGPEAGKDGSGGNNDEDGSDGDDSGDEDQGEDQGEDGNEVSHAIASKEAQTTTTAAEA